MRQIKIIWSGFFLIVFFLLSGCSFFSQPPSAPPEKQCTADTDCVPAGCCHPADAVNKDFAPGCSEMFCTMECAPGTLDCGQGEIKCIENNCRVILNEVSNKALDEAGDIS